MSTPKEHGGWKMDEMNCASCRYSKWTKPEHTGRQLECRRRAPMANVSSNRRVAWPWVKEDDWCGEYEPREGDA